MREFHQLKPEQIQLDEALRWDVYDRAGNLLLRKGYVVRDPEQAEELLERGMYVDAAEFRASQEGRPPPYDPFYIMESVQAHLAYLLESLPQDGSLQADMTAQARAVMLLAARSPDMALAAMQLVEQRNYPIAHSFFCAVLADMVARRAGWDEARRRSLVCAALSMNVGMLKLQLALRNQRDPLTPVQRKTIDEHPMLGAKLLIGCGVQDDEWLRAVLEHHEKQDGSGYPRKVKNPSELALLLHACDVFTAKLSPRTYRRPVAGSEATRQVFVGMNGDQGNPFGALLVKEVGIYPPGTIVKLANGEIGTVFKRGATAKTPVVMSLINAKGLPCVEPIRRGTEDAQYQVVGVIAQDKALVGLNFERLWRHDERC